MPCKARHFAGDECALLHLNHMPAISDDLTHTLRLYGSDAAAVQSVKDLGEHGSTRQRQGCELPDLQSETSLLSQIYQGRSPW